MSVSLQHEYRNKFYYTIMNVKMCHITLTLTLTTLLLKFFVIIEKFKLESSVSIKMSKLEIQIVNIY